MILEFATDDRLFELTIFENEDYELHDQCYDYDDVTWLNLGMTIFNHPDKTFLRFKDGDSYVTPKTLVRDLINKYGVISFDMYPKEKMLTARGWCISLIHELAAMHLYELGGINYWTSERRVYDIRTGEEIPQNSDKWNKIRDREDRKVFKTIMVGRTLEEFFVTMGWNGPLGNKFLVYSSIIPGSDVNV